MTLHKAYSVLHVKDINNEQRIITGTATTPTTDRQGDIVEPLGVKAAASLPLFLYHDSTKTVGTVRFGKATKDGIPFTAQIPNVSEPGNLKDRVDEAWQMVKYKLLGAVSIGFRALEGEIEVIKTGYRFLKTEVLELSLVPVPANAEATIQSIKSLDLAYTSAALGAQSKVEHLTPTASAVPGVSGKTSSISLKPKGLPMTYQEQISALEAKRAATMAQAENLMKKAADEGRTLDQSEEQEHDEATDGVQKIDSHLDRLRKMEKLAIEKAVAVPDSPTSVSQAVSIGNGSSYITVKRNLPKGTAFARYAKAIALSRGSRYEAAEIAKQWNDSTPEVAQYLKSAVTAGTTTSTTWAGPLVYNQNLTNEFVELLRPSTIMGKLAGLTRVPFNVRVPVQSTGSTIGWVGQIAPKPVSELAFTTITLGMAKMAGIVVLTEELARSGSPDAEALVLNDLTKQIGQFSDQQFIDPSVAAVASVSPAAITNGVTASVSVGATVANIKSDIQTALSQLATNNINTNNAVWIMNSKTAIALSLKSTSQDLPAFPQITVNGGTLEGLPVIVSNNVPSSVSGGSIIVLMDPSEVFMADEGGVELDVSREASIQMNTAPSAGAQSLVSLWQNNLVGLRAERFINYVRKRDTAVTYIDQVFY